MTPSQARENPYIGLRPFDREDSLYFFGRRGQTGDLLERLKQNRFLAVVGGSGCGKSSLIRAGLIPALFGGFLIDRRDRWLVAVLKPGDSPIANLASALAMVTIKEPVPAAAASLEKAINEDEADGVADCLKDCLGSDTNLLILVDQFEEIFSFRGTEDEEQLERLSPALRRERGQRRAEAANFVELMLALTQRENFPAYVVLTMRSDFLGDCDVFYGLPEAMNSSRYLVPRLTRQQLRDAIVGPARLTGVDIEPRLADTVLNDLGGRTDQLPVLQHALLRTWNQWRTPGTGPLDLAHYKEVGGLKDALSKHADEAIREEDLAETAKIFQCLTGTDPSQRRIRRPAHRQELVAICDGKSKAVDAIIERFKSDGRCFLVESKARDGDTRIDISHESLIRQWPRLRAWIDDERASRDQYLDLVRSARGKKALLQNPDLEFALQWRAKTWPTAAWAKRYSNDEGDFAAAMKYLDDSRAEVANIAREKKRGQTVFRATVALAMVLLAVLELYALHEKDRAETEEAKAKIEETRAVSAESVAKTLKQQATDYASAVDRQLSAVRSRASMGQPAFKIASPAAMAILNPPSPLQQAKLVASPVTLMLKGRQRSITYRNVSLNGQGNTITATPGQQFTVSFQWQGSVPTAPDCPGCIVQVYYGIDHSAGGASKCFVSDILAQGWAKTGDVKGVLNAPSSPGTYYITQTFTLDYDCKEAEAKQTNEAQDALAAVIVQ